MKIPFFMIILAILTAQDALSSKKILGLEVIPTCSLSKKRKAMPGEADQVFKKAQELLSQKKYCESALLLDQVAKHSDGNLFQDATFQLIDALYMAENYDASITAAKEYISANPGLHDPRTEYAYFMIGKNFTKESAPSPEHDQEYAGKAQTALTTYLTQYPSGKYSMEAKELVKKSYDQLAEKEIFAGKYLLKEYKYKAAAMRLQNIPKYFKNSSYMPEALYLITQAYLGMGKGKDASTVVELAKKLYPNSEYTSSAEKYLRDLVSGKRVMSYSKE